MKKFNFLLVLMLIIVGTGQVLAQCSSSQSQLTLEIDFSNDAFSDEDGWRLVNVTDGVTVDSACFGTYSASSGIEVINICVDTGKVHVLYAYDDFGDGMDGSVWTLGYTFGNPIDTIGSNAFNITDSLCNNNYTLAQNDLEDSTIRFTTILVAPPACLPATNLSTLNIASDSATASWSDNQTPLGYEIEWDTAGFMDGMANNSMIVTDTFFNITGLMSSTAYEWNVRVICGANDTSSWSRLAFTTAIQGPQGLSCMVGNPGVTYSEEFDTQGAWTGDIGTGNRVWRYNSGGTGSGGTGPSAAHSGSNYIFFETSSGTATTGSLVSGAIDLTAGSSDAELSFWLHAAGATIGTLQVGVSNSATGPFTNVFTQTGAVQSASTDPWTNVGVNLGSYVGQTIYLEFFYTMGTSFTGDIALDLVEVSTCLSCAAPSNLAASFVGLDSAALDWTENGTATMWEISYGAPGLTAGMGTQMVTMNKPFGLGSLPASTSYEYYVRSICGANDTSNWSSLGSFRTLNGTPYLEDFETFSNGRANQNGWNNVRSADPDWTADNGGTGSTGTGPDVDHTLGTAAGKYVYLETSGGSNGQRDTLSSPAVLIDANLTSLNLDFWYHMAGATMGQLQVWIESNGVWDSVTTYVGPQQTGTSDPWLLSSHVLGATYLGQSVSVHFIGERGSSFTGDMAIDDVRLYETPNCPAPSAIVASNIGLDSATIDWTENGMAMMWEVSYGALGFTAGQGTQMIVSSKPTNITGLMASTNYDVYVRSVCGANDTSGWSPVAGTFRTLNGIPYLEDFEAFNFGNPTQNGWSNSASGNPQWIADAGGTPSTGTGPLVDHTLGTSTGNYIFLETSGSTAGNRDTLSSAAVLVDANLSSLSMSFWYHMNGLSMGDLQVWVEANGIWDSITTISGQQQAAQADPWLQAIANLGGTYLGQSVTMHFIGNAGTSYTGDMAIDDVQLFESVLSPISLPITWDDGATVDLTTIDFGGNMSMLTADPTNPTNTVLQSIKPMNAQVWAGVSFGDSLDTAIAFDPMNTILSAVVWAPAAGFNVKLKAENNVNPGLSVETDVMTTKAGWDTLAFDMSLHSTGAPLNFTTIYNKLSIFYNFGANATTDTFYVDLVEFTGGTAPPPAKDKIGLPITWEDTANVDYTVIDFGGNASMLVTDPTNASNLVMQSIKTANSQVWAGTSFGNSLDTAINFSTGNTTIRALVWAPAAGMEVRLKVEDQTNPGISVETVDTTTMIGWDTLNFDMSNEFPNTAAINFANTYDKMSIFYNFGQAPATADTFYVDYVAFENPPVIVMDPHYPIGTINTEDANGVADSNGVRCWISGTTVGYNRRGSGHEFVLVDMSSGSQEGVTVFEFSPVNGYSFQEGDSLMILGDVSQFNGLVQFRPDSIVVLQSGLTLPTPIIANTMNASTENKLVSVTDDFVLLSLPSTTSSSNFTATNGVDTMTIRIDSDSDIEDSLAVAALPWVIGDTLCGMIGVGGQFDNSSPFTDGYQFFPRSWNDITFCRNTTSLEEVDAITEVSIYPNPTNSNITIEHNGFSSNEVRFEIRDLSGRTIKAVKLTSPSSANRIDIDLSDAANGIYFLNIIDGENRRIEKIIKH